MSKCQNTATITDLLEWRETRHPQKSTTPDPTDNDDSSGESATIFYIDFNPSKKDIIKELFDEIMSEITSLPKQQGDADALLGEISKSIASIFEELDDRQKLQLSAQLSFGLSGCGRKILDTVARYPTLLHTVAIAAKLPEDNCHPAYQALKNRAKWILGMIPGKYDLATGTYTPPNQ